MNIERLNVIPMSSYSYYSLVSDPTAYLLVTTGVGYLQRLQIHSRKM